MFNIHDLPLEIQKMIVQHAMCIPKYILYTMPYHLQQVYPIDLQLKICDDRVILHRVEESLYGTELVCFKETNTEEPFIVTPVPKIEGCFKDHSGEYWIHAGVVTIVDHDPLDWLERHCAT